jgi:hypothetical protein
MIQQLVETGDTGSNGNFVFPLELGAHTSEELVPTSGGSNVIHDIHVNVIEINPFGSCKAMSV